MYIYVTFKKKEYIYIKVQLCSYTHYCKRRVCWIPLKLTFQLKWSVEFMGGTPNYTIQSNQNWRVWSKSMFQLKKKKHKNMNIHNILSCLLLGIVVKILRFISWILRPVFNLKGKDSYLCNESHLHTNLRIHVWLYDSLLVSSNLKIQTIRLGKNIYCWMANYSIF